MTFQLNDTVLYGTQSICTVTEICQKKIGGEMIPYYLLSPVFDSKSTIYVPCKNEKLTAKMRRVLSKTEILNLIQCISNEETAWIDNDTERKETFAGIIQSGDRISIARLIRTLYAHKLKQKAAGKKFHSSDEVLLDRAQKLLHEEFAYVLDLQPQEIPPFIAGQLAAANA